MRDEKLLCLEGEVQTKKSGTLIQKTPLTVLSNDNAYCNNHESPRARGPLIASQKLRFAPRNFTQFCSSDRSQSSCSLIDQFLLSRL